MVVGGCAAKHRMPLYENLPEFMQCTLQLAPHTFQKSRHRGRCMEKTGVALEAEPQTKCRVQYSVQILTVQAGCIGISVKGYTKQTQ